MLQICADCRNGTVLNQQKGNWKKLCLKTRNLCLTVLKSSSKEMLFMSFLFPFCQKLMPVAFL